MWCALKRLPLVACAGGGSEVEEAEVRALASLANSRSPRFLYTHSQTRRQKSARVYQSPFERNIALPVL